RIREESDEFFVEHPDVVHRTSGFGACPEENPIALRCWEHSLKDVHWHFGDDVFRQHVLGKRLEIELEGIELRAVRKILSLEVGGATDEPQHVLEREKVAHLLNSNTEHGGSPGSEWIAVVPDRIARVEILHEK